MELTTLQKTLIQELKQQGANKDAINSVILKALEIKNIARLDWYQNLML